MADSGETENKKRARCLVQVVSDSDAGTVKHFSMSLWIAVLFLAAAVALVIAVLSDRSALKGDLNRSRQNEQVLRSRVEALEEQNEALLTEQDNLIAQQEELQEKVVILSDTVNEKVQQEREREEAVAQTYIPTGFPLKGTASYNENETQLDGNPVAVFHASPGTSVVATANGTVSSIAGGEEAGYIVMVDHGNGYYTVYHTGTSPRVKEGDAVTNTTELFRIEAGREELEYQIIENDKYIAPLSLMETYG
ncbi:MAG: peptidoglycan DD-metalloendopeptidase family protein [Lachnospiraceae bacterium]|nr:peptidoglycan DD-metalloendopeptidase family protein [Lachnospiraceae bacterium]